MMAAIFMSGSIVALFLVIWFRTEAFVEYCRLFHLDRISHYKDYDEKKSHDASLTYLSYLRQYHNGFKTRLLTCPVCVAVWLAMLNAIFFSKLSVFPVTFIGGLILFGVIDRLLG